MLYHFAVSVQKLAHWCQALAVFSKLKNHRLDLYGLFVLNKRTKYTKYDPAPSCFFQNQKRYLQKNLYWLKFRGPGSLYASC